MQARLAQPCLLCGARSRAGLLCPACAADLPRLPAERCPVCAMPTPGGAVCGACLKRAPAYDRTEAVFRYAFPADVLVQRLKYGGQTVLAGYLAGLMAPSARPDLIVAMPLHPHRLRERGYNQAALLAGHLARRLALPFAATACRRLRDTPPQVDLPVKARRRNLRGAFDCTMDLAGRHVALVDDVMTSGASLDELARVVKRAGAAEVSAWVVARTVRD
ncbi:ComF family protein [Parasulfuritortus cantonensis]|uniref:ComF family protein n=1 Tax=Parasulfuritortus cantonensis TaxID=2528202 RepID=A0A4R1BL81_9PROT|nr:ComF family protein [Parasulfuritortus cantonensis]TCJ18170.1 ComF family protein [Parasulfuritortus cantonensis]